LRHGGNDEVSVAGKHRDEGLEPAFLLVLLTSIAKGGDMRPAVRRTGWLLAIAPFALLSFAMFGPSASSQKAQQLPLTQSQALLQSWNDIGRKLIAMADDFPEEKYDFRPSPAQRTFAEQLLHVAGSNDLFSDIASGTKPVDDEDRAHYPGKSAVVAYLKKSSDKGAAAIAAKGEAGMSETVVDSESGQRLPLAVLAWELIEHSGEHYGQLVVYYRVAGLVPPESRPKKP
jgi:uncharacterized damage-inducible protein DinB